MSIFSCSCYLELGKCETCVVNCPRVFKILLGLSMTGIMIKTLMPVRMDEQCGLSTVD